MSGSPWSVHTLINQEEEVHLKDERSPLYPLQLTPGHSVGIYSGHQLVVCWLNSCVYVVYDKLKSGEGVDPKSS